MYDGGDVLRGGSSSDVRERKAHVQGGDHEYTASAREALTVQRAGKRRLSGVHSLLYGRRHESFTPFPHKQRRTTNYVSDTTLSGKGAPHAPESAGETEKRHRKTREVVKHSIESARIRARNPCGTRAKQKIYFRSDCFTSELSV